MSWSKKDSLVNRISESIASNGVGYTLKQWIADVVAGEYDQDETMDVIYSFTQENKAAIFSFTTCPYCRAAKDYLDENGIHYEVMELDLLEGNKGNEIRATLGRLTRRTSVPSIFINGKAIGGLNDGMPGLLQLEKSELSSMLQGTQ